jgi:hypothetical protein
MTRPLLAASGTPAESLPNGFPSGSRAPAWAVEAAARLLGVSDVTFHLRARRSAGLRRIAGAGNVLLSPTPLADERRLLRIVAGGRADPSQTRSTGPGSGLLAAAPVPVGGEVQGVLAVHGPVGNGGTLSRVDWAILRAVAEQAGAALGDVVAATRLVTGGTAPFARREDGTCARPTPQWLEQRFQFHLGLSAVPGIEVLRDRRSQTWRRFFFAGVRALERRNIGKEVVLTRLALLGGSLAREGGSPEVARSGWIALLFALDDGRAARPHSGETAAARIYGRVVQLVAARLPRPDEADTP